MDVCGSVEKEGAELRSTWCKSMDLWWEEYAERPGKAMLHRNAAGQEIVGPGDAESWGLASLLPFQEATAFSSSSSPSSLL